MKYIKLFDTDFYQLTMSLAYIVLNNANDNVGFEAFYRHPKPKVDDKNYVFSGEERIHEVMREVKDNLNDKEACGTFLELLKHRIPEGKFNEYSNIVSAFWDKSSKDFNYTVYPEGARLDPYVPCFQYYGPKWIGQLLETIVLVEINGRTGLATQKRNGHPEIEFLNILVNAFDEDCYEKLKYTQMLRDRATEYRKAADGVILLDASYRRAPSPEVAMTATEIAIEEGWDGTANAGAAMKGLIDISKVGGTHAHSFVMSNALAGENHETEAFIGWDKVFPHTTLLVDTYDTKKGISKVIKNDLHPNDIRLDSEPLDVLAVEARKILDESGRKDIKLFLSGDLTPERFLDFKERNIPIDKGMAGTKYVNCGIGEDVNCGFVYKAVVVERDGKKAYPEKKAEGKGSISSLKKVYVVNNELHVTKNSKCWGINVDSDFNEVVWDE